MIIQNDNLDLYSCLFIIKYNYYNFKLLDFIDTFKIVN